MFSMSQPFLGMEQLLPDMLEVLTTNVLKFDAFEEIPNTLLGIKLRRIGRQAFDVNALGSTLFQEILDSLSAMNAGSVPNDEDLARNLSQEKL